MRWEFHQGQRFFAPGEHLQGKFFVAARIRPEVSALELAVLWRTSGKGDEDTCVLEFTRRGNSSHGKSTGSWEDDFFCTMPLPNSPLSYEGFLIKIQWLVRLRVFLDSKREIVVEERFELQS